MPFSNHSPDSEEEYSPPSPYPGEEEEALVLDDIDEDVMVLDDDDVPQAQEVVCPQFVWECEMIEKGSDSTGKRFWTCLHCNYKRPEWNSTKAKAHLAKAKKEDVKPCPAVHSSAEVALYAMQWKVVTDKRAEKAAVPAEAQLATARMSQAVQVMVDRGTSRAAVQLSRRAPAPSNMASNRNTAREISIVGASRPPLGPRPTTVSRTSSTSTPSTVSMESFQRVTQDRKGIQTYLTNNHCSPQACLEMDYGVTAFILEGGFPFSIAQDPNFARLIKLAKHLPMSYKVPHRHKIAGAYMDLLYEERLQTNLVLLQKDANIFGVGGYCDGATIKGSPLLNFLCCSVYIPAAVMEIKDSSDHMAQGGRKDATYIADTMTKHLKSVDPKGDFVDIVIFDGASNVQKAGKILEIRFPRSTCLHGSEHVVSLFFSDVAKTDPGKRFIRLYQMTNAWFGGRHHACHAMFMGHSRKCNRGKLIGLITPSGTRMAGYWIALTRLIRHKDTFESLFSDPAFKALKADAKPPADLVALLKNPELWKFLLMFMRCMFGALRLLRLCDKKVPTMDKMYYFVLKVDQWLVKHHGDLNEWDEMDESLFITDLVAFTDTCKSKGANTGDDSSDSDDDDNSVSSYDSGVTTIKWGTAVRIIWEKRREKLCHDFAKAGYILSPVPEIREHVKLHMSLDLKQAVERVLKKLFLPVDLSNEDEMRYLSTMYDVFWEEYDQFDSRTGPVFGEARAYIWNSADIINNRSHVWHKKYSHLETHWLGKLACRVTSKITGMGNAERNWGDVKHLKSGQRSHLTSDRVSKAATIYGAACSERASMKNPVTCLATVTTWEDEDMASLGLNDFGVDLHSIMAVTLPQKVYRCWTEDWELDILNNPDIEHQARLLTKYAGLVFEDDGMYTVHNTLMYFQKRRGNSSWHVYGCTPDYNPNELHPDDYDYFEINDDFHGVVFEHYRKNPDAKVRCVVPDGALADDGSWNNWMAKPPAHKKHRGGGR